MAGFRCLAGCFRGVLGGAVFESVVARVARPWAGGRGRRGVRGETGETPGFGGVSPVSPALLAGSSVRRRGAACALCRAPARRQGTFPGHPALVLLAPSAAMGKDITPACPGLLLRFRIDHSCSFTHGVEPEGS